MTVDLTRVRMCPMNAHQAYTGSRRHSWTRIDMVIALYQATLNSMEQLEQQLIEGNVLPATQMKLQRRLLGILAGLDLSVGDLPMRIAQLVRWALSQLPTPSPHVWRQVIKSFRTICEAYESIRSEAAEQELAS